MDLGYHDPITDTYRTGRYGPRSGPVTASAPKTASPALGLSPGYRPSSPFLMATTPGLARTSPPPLAAGSRSPGTAPLHTSVAFGSQLPLHLRHSPIAHRPLAAGTPPYLRTSGGGYSGLAHAGSSWAGATPAYRTPPHTSALRYPEKPSASSGLWEPSWASVARDRDSDHDRERDGDRDRDRDSHRDCDGGRSQDRDAAQACVRSPNPVPKRAHTGSAMPTPDPEVSQSVRALAAALRLRVDERQLKALFEDGHAALEEAALRRCLRRLGVDLPDAKEAALLAQLRLPSHGGVGYREFHRGLRGLMHRQGPPSGLRQVLVVMRHGAHYPPLPPAPEAATEALRRAFAGQLTPAGAQQLLSMGQAFHAKYVREGGLLDPEDPYIAELLALTTDAEPCAVQSALHFLQVWLWGDPKRRWTRKHVCSALQCFPP